ncbi:S-layer homology domain-containing protein [Paenibacillus radicis (ex Xue et al. 2023)]|uniref:S-layer homology domain-containing protein n=1 Tax=Paenibacillus radicis (ex Xue et al. 2023) TaxID=2972489 RepID=A0ABT1YD91_9BACL|nr:S-layer homology domain-containing protein [Paenibacillus radicis (ex Xue et al. 2023)]MCR8631142.1 S-layer homology domain-containing protein [Paenibacillus radicis (ex Xue et al. 2023)]
MRIVKGSLIISLALCLSLSTPIVFAENQRLQNQAVDGGVINQNIVFIDVKNHWANDAITDMSKKGIVSGYEDSSFQPEKSITREEFAKMIAITFSVDLASPSTPTYTDVSNDKWSYLYIEATKNYLTGYYPPKGKAFFSPETKATREDVAVALVKVLGFTTNSSKNSDILAYKFKDAADISYGIRDYIAIATEKQLISGYEDRTFRPDKPITRAEVATLLYRVIKSSAQDQTDGPPLEVNMPETTSNGTYYISGKTHRDAKVSINGKEIPVSDGEFKEGFILDKEGSYDIKIASILPSGKSTTINKRIKYQVGGPSLNVDSVPEVVESNSLTISGSASDENDFRPAIYINAEKAGEGSFNKTITLHEGENVLTIKAVSSTGKETVVTRKVTLNLGGPALKIDDIPATTDREEITISGSATDKNDYSPAIYLNDEKIGNGSFNKTVNLVEGENVLTFKAKNEAGKTTTIVKRITFTVGGSILKLDEIPTATEKSSFTVTGSATDKNNYSPVIYLNDAKIGDGSFLITLSLEEGENLLVFRVKNSLGKETYVTKKIIFTPPAPKLTIDYIPTTTRSQSINVTGSVQDKNDDNPYVLLNEQWAGTGRSFSKYVKLTKGENQLNFKAVNSFGKSTTVTKVVYYQE